MALGDELMRTIKDPEERKAEIIAASRELFEKYGVENTKVSQIVQKVGVAQGLFYYYFRSKDEVIAAVIEDVLSEIEEVIKGIINDPEKNFYQKLAGYIDLYLTTIKRFMHSTNDKFVELNDKIRQYRLDKRAETYVISNLMEIMNIGVREGALGIKYPQDMMLMVLYGISVIMKSCVMDEDKLFTMVEQGLNLPVGCLTSGHI